MQTLIVICSKYPNPTLPNCVRNLYEKQIKQSLDYKICIVDSESTDLMHYRKVEDEFPDVEICYVNNKNYEYGAWKYASMQESLLDGKSIADMLVESTFNKSATQRNTWIQPY